jgi:type VI secretion system protein ImpH
LVKTEEELIKLMRQRKEEEQNARKFFIPFEAAINHLRMQVAIYENRLDKRTHHDELVHVFTDHWDIFQYLDTKQADLFLHLIPILHEIRDNHPVVENIMQIMLQLPVQIVLQSQMPIRPAVPLLSSLGDSTLGVNLTTGNERYDEGVEEIVIKIGPVTIEEFQQFTPEGRKHKILELLCDYLLPVHVDIVTEIVLHEKDRTARFAEEANHLNSVLGVDTYL